MLLWVLSHGSLRIVIQALLGKKGYDDGWYWRLSVQQKKGWNGLLGGV
jgi:hypothetical protein